LATVTAEGRPHVVPCCFALDGERIFTAVDDVKAKRTLELRRLDNIRRHPHASLIVDHYDDDWSTLWWVRIDADAATVEPQSPDDQAAHRLLASKYEQYRAQPPPGPVIVLSIVRWRGWP
jgi:PPOX class probable F420-dependent enzyme